MVVCDIAAYCVYQPNFGSSGSVFEQRDLSPTAPSLKLKYVAI